MPFDTPSRADQRCAQGTAVTVPWLHDPCLVCLQARISHTSSFPDHWVLTRTRGPEPCLSIVCSLGLRRAYPYSFLSFQALIIPPSNDGALGQHHGKLLGLLFLCYDANLRIHPVHPPSGRMAALEAETHLILVPDRTTTLFPPIIAILTRWCFHSGSSSVHRVRSSPPGLRGPILCTVVTVVHIFNLPTSTPAGADI
jgi:hypothetical protein